MVCCLPKIGGSVSALGAETSSFAAAAVGAGAGKTDEGYKGSQVMGVRKMKRWNIHVKKRVCLVVALLLLFLFTLCVLFSAGHACSDLHCPICALLRLSQKLFALLSLCRLGAWLPSLFGRPLPGSGWGFPFRCAQSPVGDRVKLTS